MKKKTITYFASLIVLTLGIYEGMNVYFHRLSAVVKVNVVVKRDIPNYPLLQDANLVGQSDVEESSLVTPSPDGNLLSLVAHGNQLTVIQSRDGRSISYTTATDSVLDVKWVSPRLLLFMTRNNTLYTFDVVKHKVREIQRFYVYSGMTYKTIAFSPYTNDIFVIFGNTSGNTVYQFNTNGDYSIRGLGNIAPLASFYGSTNTTLYVEEMHHTLYQLQSGYLSKLKERVTIIKGVGDALYYGTLDQNNRITAVGRYLDGSWILTSKLPNPADLEHVVVDHAGHVFEFDDKELIDATAKKRWRIPSGSQLKKADNTLLLLSQQRYQVIVN